MRVKLYASSVNPADVKRRGQGTYGMEFPRIIPNSDGAGIVDQVGAGVSKELLGKRVWLFNGQRGRAYGTAAEYIALDSWLVRPLPDDLSYAEGACLGIPCMTAHRALFADGPVEGKTVLVTGGAGAVGHYAIQWAKRGGATVITTVSSDKKAEHARAAGADHLINYKNEDVAERALEITSGGGVDRIIEVDLGANFVASLGALKPGGVISTYYSSSDPQGLFMRTAQKNAVLRFMVLHSVPRPALDQARADVDAWLAEGTAIHTVAEEFPLEECVAAHEFVEAGSKLGTVIVNPGRSGRINS